MTAVLEWISKTCMDNPYVKYHVEENPNYREYPGIPSDMQLLHEVYGDEPFEEIVVTRGKWLFDLGMWIFRLSLKI